MKIECYALSSRGKVRKENQDRYFLPFNESIKNDTELQFCDLPATVAVFDGMGGEALGEVAAYIAQQVCKTVLEKNPEYSLKKLTLKINTQICRYMQQNHINSMGTTSVLLRVKDGVAEICNVGDSRAYRIADKKLMCLSIDHTMNVAGKRILTQNLGIPQDEMILEPAYVRGKIREKDTFLLCSDGLTDFVNEQKILNIINSTEFEKAGKALFDEAMAGGGKDNITIVLCKIV